MLEQKDLEAIALLLDNKLEKNNEQMKNYIREQITGSETFLLEEMERLHNSTNAKIEFLQKNISELTQYYKITKLEEELKKKTA